MYFHWRCRFCVGPRRHRQGPLLAEGQQDHPRAEGDDGHGRPDALPGAGSDGDARRPLPASAERPYTVEV